MLNLQNTFLGFTDNMKSMQKARVEKSLNKKYRYNKNIMTAKEWIYTKLLEGSTPYVEENYSCWSSRLDDYTKPKNDYRLNNNNDTYVEISKTEYDYACYLLEKEFLNEQNIIEFIAAEQNRIEFEVQKDEERKQREKAEKESKERERVEFENWQWKQVELYNNIEKLEIAKEIFINEIGHFGEQQKRLLVLIDNIDNINCREKLKSWLHYDNAASKKVFYHITGIKLPNTNKETRLVLDGISANDFIGVIPYKKRQERKTIDVKKEIKLEQFYEMIRIPDSHFEPVMAEPIQKYGLDMFIKETNKGYVLSEAKTGLMITSGKTKKEIFDKLKEFIDKNTIDKVNEMLNNAINMYGLSPKYNNDINVLQEA